MAYLEVDGITFRSKLEAYCYNALKKAKIKFDYEEPRFQLVENFDYEKDCWEVNKRKKPYALQNKQKVRGITYTPDFTNIRDG